MTLDSGEPVASNPPFFQAGGSASMTLYTVPRQLNVYQITEDELESLYTSGNMKTLDVGLFSLSFGVFVTIAGTLLTVDFTKPLVLAVFWASMLVAILASILFGVRAVMQWKSAERRMNTIRQTAKP